MPQVRHSFAIGSLLPPTDYGCHKTDRKDATQSFPRRNYSGRSNSLKTSTNSLPFKAPVSTQVHCPVAKSDSPGHCWQKAKPTQRRKDAKKSVRENQCCLDRRPTRQQDIAFLRSPLRLGSPSTPLRTGFAVRFWVTILELRDRSNGLRGYPCPLGEGLGVLREREGDERGTLGRRRDGHGKGLVTFDPYSGQCGVPAPWIS
jgi:hypothetical protein